MKILLVHNFYRQPGGEDVVFNNEAMLLREHGDEVVLYTRSNDEINEGSLSGNLQMLRETIWSKRTAKDLDRLIRKEKPEVVHFHNIFPLISVAGYQACRDNGVPVVQTIHNYRMLCPKATLFRNGEVCEDCAGKVFPWPGILHACYRNRRVETAVVAAMSGFHQLARIRQNRVNMFIVLTSFARELFIANGLQEEKIFIKPNFIIPDPGPGEHKGNFALFAGRLSDEKGIISLIEAWKGIEDFQLRIVGDGPLYEMAAEIIRKHNLANIKLMGGIPRQEVIDLMQTASFLVFPSIWYEGFPVTLAEAFACGLPVLGSSIGAVKEIIDDDKTGLLFRPGDVQDLQRAIQWVLTNPVKMEQMGKRAREKYLNEYTQERNYKLLMDVYRSAISQTQ